MVPRAPKRPRGFYAGPYTADSATGEIRAGNGKVVLEVNRGRAEYVAYMLTVAECFRTAAQILAGER